MSKLTTPLEDRLVSEAEFGMFYMYENITHKKAKELVNKGFIVKDSMENKNFPRQHKIDWKQAVVECEDINSLSENDSQYSFAQKLWITSMKNQPTVAK